MTDSGPMGMSSFPRVHHRRKHGHGLMWWLVVVVAIGAVVWFAAPWLRARGYLPQ